jgi:hypothetical protein
METTIIWGWEMLWSIGQHIAFLAPLIAVAWATGSYLGEN